ncbi:MAG: hypothetical protein AB8B91_13115 [Rubripirellula sp.]
MECKIFEEHASALAHWWSLPKRGQTLICFDTHLDLQSISQDRLDRLAQADSASGIAQLAKPHHLCPDAGYSYGIEDFLFAASELGLIDRLIWVAPPHIDTHSASEAIDQLRQLDGVTTKDLLGLRRITAGTQQWIEGRVLGLDLTICSLEELACLDLPDECLVDIDIDYFVAVPETRLTSTPDDVFAALFQRNIDYEMITVSRSVRSGFTPLRYRFLAEQTQALVQSDQRATAHYHVLIDADEKMNRGDITGASEQLLSELAEWNDCPATHFAISLVDQDAKLAASHRERAALICPEYDDDPLREASLQAGRFQQFAESDVRLLVDQIEREPISKQHAALTHAAIGLLWCELGDVANAVQHYQATTQHFTQGHPELGLELGKLLLDADLLSQAISYFNAALLDNKTQTAAMLYMSICHFKAGRFQEAQSLLTEANRNAPAWADPIILLANVMAAWGDTDAAAAHAAHHAQLEQLFAESSLLLA